MLTKDLVDSLLTYKDGKLYWKVNRGNVKAESLAGCHAFKGYWVVRIGGKNHYYHRVIYLMHNGESPSMIDHIDGDPSNNRIDNLRAADVTSNAWNQKTQKNNKSGVKGVSWNKRAQKWVAYCMANKVQHHLGSFVDLNDARSAVEAFRLSAHHEFTRHE